MSLYKEWKKAIKNHQSREEQMAFWDKFCNQEKEIYRDLLGKGQKILKGTVKELSEEYNMSEVYFMGFLDGINESIEEQVDVESLESDSKIDIEIDFEKLYYNMLKVPAEWLYSLPEWDHILDEEKRNEIAKKQKSDKTVIKENKIGRNEPCPCGSGKKYKKCCGK